MLAVVINIKATACKSHDFLFAFRCVQLKDVERNQRVHSQHPKYTAKPLVASGGSASI